jgi:hypothetical protein
VTFPRHPPLPQTGETMSDTLTLPPPQIGAPSLGHHTKRWLSRALGSLTEAEDLLDWLAAHGFTERAFVIFGPLEFVVKWR